MPNPFSCREIGDDLAFGAFQQPPKPLVIYPRQPIRESVFGKNPNDLGQPPCAFIDPNQGTQSHDDRRHRKATGRLNSHLNSRPLYLIMPAQLIVICFFNRPDPSCLPIKSDAAIFVFLWELETDRTAIELLNQNQGSCSGESTPF